MPMNFAVLYKSPSVYHSLKLLFAHEVIVLSVHFSFTSLPRCVAHAETDLLFVLLHKLVNQGSFASARWPADDQRLKPKGLRQINHIEGLVLAGLAEKPVLLNLSNHGFALDLPGIRLEVTEDGVAVLVKNRLVRNGVEQRFQGVLDSFRVFINTERVEFPFLFVHIHDRNCVARMVLLEIGFLARLL